MSPDTDDAVDVADDLDEAELDDLEGGRWEEVYSYAYLTALALAVLGGIYTVYRLVRAGYIDTDITIAVNADIGWVIEWFIAGVIGVFLLRTLIQVLRATGVSFWNSVLDSVASVADSYERDGGDGEG